MGRATELFDFLSKDEVIEELYSSLTITAELRAFKKALTKTTKDGLILDKDGSYNLW